MQQKNARNAGNAILASMQLAGCNLQQLRLLARAAVSAQRQVECAGSRREKILMNACAVNRWTEMACLNSWSPAGLKQPYGVAPSICPVPTCTCAVLLDIHGLNRAQLPSTHGSDAHHGILCLGTQQYCSCSNAYPPQVQYSIPANQPIIYFAWMQVMLPLP